MLLRAILSQRAVGRCKAAENLRQSRIGAGLLKNRLVIGGHGGTRYSSGA